MQFKITPAVKVLLIAYFTIFILQQTLDQFFGMNVAGVFALTPRDLVVNLRIWQIFTYSFLHADVLHLFLNCLMLVFIGSDIESIWGSKRFLFYFFFCSMSAGAIYLLFQVFITGGLNVPMVGASGGIYGLLTAYGLIFGERVLLFMMLFPMKAKHFIWILAGIELMTTVFSRGGGLSGVAHLAGMGTGFMYLWVDAWSRIQKRQRGTSRINTQKKKHLKLVIDNVRHQGSEFEEEPDDDPKTWH